MGSLTQIHFTAQNVSDWRGAVTAKLDIRKMFHLLLMEKGIFAAERGAFNISAPMDEEEIGKTKEAVRGWLHDLTGSCENL
jgi:glutamate-1-semialdehyde aminotransferase